jgi:hypothetical protein
MPTFVRSKRFCHPRLAAALVLALAAGCSGKLPSAEDLAKVKMGMSLAEVEGVLGSGKTPDGDFLDGDKQGQTVRRQWGSGDHWLILTFRNDKLVAYRGHNVRGIGESLPPSAIGPRPAVPEADTPSPAPAMTREEITRRAQATTDLVSIYHLLFRYAGRHGDRLPANEGEFGKLDKFAQEAFDKIHSGQYVVCWGSTIKASVLAYEKDAPEQGGFVLRKSALVEKMTADVLKAELAKK